MNAADVRDYLLDYCEQAAQQLDASQDDRVPLMRAGLRAAFEAIERIPVDQSFTSYCDGALGELGTAWIGLVTDGVDGDPRNTRASALRAVITELESRRDIPSPSAHLLQMLEGPASFLARRHAAGVLGPVGISVDAATRQPQTRTFKAPETGRAPDPAHADLMTFVQQFEDGFRSGAISLAAIFFHARFVDDSLLATTDADQANALVAWLMDSSDEALQAIVFYRRRPAGLPIPPPPAVPPVWEYLSPAFTPRLRSELTNRAS